MTTSTQRHVCGSRKLLFVAPGHRVLAAFSAWVVLATCTASNSALAEAASNSAGLAESSVISQRSDLHEKSTMSVTISFPTTDTVIDEGTTPSVPINVSVSSSTPVESVTVQVCRTSDDSTCSDTIFPPSRNIVTPDGLFQAIWGPPPYGVQTPTTYRFMAWASVRNSAGETTTSDSTSFTYIKRPSRKITLTNPSSDAGFLAPASPLLWVTTSTQPADPATVDHVDFLDGSTLLGTLPEPNSIPAGYAFLWKDATVGAHEVWARAVDSLGHTTTTHAVSVYVIPPPDDITVSLTLPHSGDTFSADAPIQLHADASVSAGTIERVEFVDGAAIIATVFAPPFDATWLKPSLGNHAISARAFDDLGNASASPAAYVRTLDVRRPPAIILASPRQGSVAALNSTIAFSSIVDAPEVGISHIEYWVDGEMVGSSAASPFAFTWVSPTFGQHRSAAVVYDLSGRKGTSDTVAFDVTVDGKPTNGDPTLPHPDVVLTSPANQTSYVEGDTVPLVAMVSQIAGTISRVDFIVNDQVVSTVSSAPWIANWVATTIGSYTVAAVATNNEGDSARSTTATIMVASLPTTVTLAAPPADASFYAGELIGLRPATMHVTGSVSRVEYFVDGVLAGRSAAAPYTYNWYTETAGTHSVSARVYDTAGNSGQSEPVSIRIKEIAVNITSPVDGAIIDDATVLVEGSYEGPANVGIVVNGVVAVNDGKGHFFLNDISLPDATNVLEATATSLGGSRVSTSVTVNADVANAASALHVHAAADEGIDTLTTGIAVDDPDQVASWRVVDLFGGTAGPGTPGSGEIASLTFNAPGTYTPTIEVTDKQGNVIRRRVVVLVSSSAEVVSARMTIVNQFLDALVSQQKPRALATLTGGLAAQFSAIYDSLEDHWPEIVHSFDAVGATMYGTETFEAAVTRVNGDQKFLYLIEGMRDSDGVWRIDSF